MAHSRILSGFILVAGAAAVVLVLAPQNADAENYWSVGLPTYEMGSMPSTLLSTTYHGTGPVGGGPAVGTATIWKAGLTPVAALTVPSASTLQYSYGEFYSATQLSNAATYMIQTTDPDWSIMQTTAVYGVSATTDATRLLPESKLGRFYSVATAANAAMYTNPNPSYFTVISMKDSTTVEVQVSVKTAGAAGTVPVMIPGSTYLFSLDRGWALHVTSYDGDITCVVNVLGCAPGDLTGSTIKASTSVAVFAGSNCLPLDDTSCDTINEQMMPDKLAGQVYVICSAMQSGTGQRDWLKIRAVNGPTVITFARAAVGGITTDTVLPNMWKKYVFTQDTVVTASDAIHVVQYLASSNVNPQQQGANNPVGTVAVLYYGNSGGFGDPAYAQISPIDIGTQVHWMFSNPSWENHLYVGFPSGTPIMLTSPSGTGPLPGTERPIGSSGYSCQTPLLLTPASSGDTYRVSSPEPITVQMMGLGFFTAYFYDSFGSTPVVIPPPTPPTTSFKWTPFSTSCGMGPISFTDGTAKGTGDVNEWLWNFGDGAVSTDQNPTHQYAAPGEYQVTLTVTDEYGYVAQASDTVIVLPGEVCIFPTIPQDNGFDPRAPHDGVSAVIAEADLDKDGIANAIDNCLYVANTDQWDTDFDAAGDACDLDMDADGVINPADNCVETQNAVQLDLDADGDGDTCDDDVDGDERLNVADNCPVTPNADQVDQDGDLIGDLCEDGLLIGPQGGNGASAPVAKELASLAVPAPAGTPWGLLMVAGAVALGLVVMSIVVVARRKA